MDAIDLRVISDRSKEKCCSRVLAVARMLGVGMGSGPGVSKVLILEGK